MKKQLSEYFTIDELTHSSAALRNGLDNSPGETELAALKRLVQNLLEPLRKSLGKPIIISSGFRNQAVNRLVGGVATSQHTKGEAADCYTSLGARRLLDVLLESKLSFDQAILYGKKNFLHISYRNQSANRKMVLYKLLLLLFLFSSCASRKTSSRSASGSDSLRQTTSLSIRQMAIPESRAELQIPAAGLRELPPAALYTAKSGQATATVRFLRDTLFVSASCDSLQQLVYGYQQQIERLSSFEQKKSSKSESRNALSYFLICFLLSCAGFFFYRLIRASANY